VHKFLAGLPVSTVAQGLAALLSIPLSLTSHVEQRTTHLNYGIRTNDANSTAIPPLDNDPHIPSGKTLNTRTIISYPNSPINQSNLSPSPIEPNNSPFCNPQTKLIPPNPNPPHLPQVDPLKPKSNNSPSHNPPHALQSDQTSPNQIPESSTQTLKAPSPLKRKSPEVNTPTELPHSSTNEAIYIDPENVTTVDPENVTTTPGLRQYLKNKKFKKINNALQGLSRPDTTTENVEDVNTKLSCCSESCYEEVGMVKPLPPP
jgi:hypothetical protein